MRSPTIALALLCLACALPSAAQDPRRPPEPAPPPAAEPAREAASAAKDDRGFWGWLRGKEDARPSRPVEIPDRVERPERVERPDRPERAGGGCCQ